MATTLEWAQKKRGRAFQAMNKNPEDEHLREVFEHWKTIIKALRIMEEDEEEQDGTAIHHDKL